MWVEHALRMRSVVRLLYDGWAVHIRRKRVHGRSKLLVVLWLGLSIQVRVKVRARARECFFSLSSYKM